jgi:hypothetical protein
MTTTITLGAGITVGSGIAINAGPFYGQNTIGVQNVAGSNDYTGFFFLGSPGGWNNDTNSPSFNDIQPGWTVVNLPGARVVSTNPGDQTVTVTGGMFISGSTYAFTGN